MDLIIKTFQKLSLNELYNLLQLRSEVFVVEQDCVYQDVDGKDEKALHILGLLNNELVAYTRCFRPGDYFNEASIGRVVVQKEHRKKGLAHLIMKRSIEVIIQKYKTNQIKVSAQTHLKDFYEAHGFKKTGEEYLEDSIPHISMILNTTEDD
jgi:ElaA protein